MDKFELQKLRDLPIEGVAEQLGLHVEHHKCLCPFHDDHSPSLTFSVSRNTFRCWACGEHGGTIDLVMKCQNVGFKEACSFLNSPSKFLDALAPRRDCSRGREGVSRSDGGVCFNRSRDTLPPPFGVLPLT